MMVSIATAMIPFLQNDDANRALMGANMQRQAVPLLRPEAPIVATGQEHKNCIDSEVAILAEGPGIVTKVSARYITVKYDNGSTKEYRLTKYLRSNHGTSTTAPASTSAPSWTWASGWSSRMCWPTAPPPTGVRSLWAGTSSWAL